MIMDKQYLKLYKETTDQTQFRKNHKAKAIRFYIH